MIDTALATIKNELSAFIWGLPELSLPDSADIVELSSIVKPNGQSAMKPETLIITLANIEEERANKLQRSVSVAPDGRVSQMNPEIRLNVYLIIIANFENYLTGLKYLSAVVRFFQGKCVFTRQNTPSIDPSIDGLLMDLYTLNFEQQNHLWASLGVKYQPSVVYKLRLVPVQDAAKPDDAQARRN